MFIGAYDPCTEIGKILILEKAHRLNRVHERFTPNKTKKVSGDMNAKVGDVPI